MYPTLIYVAITMPHTVQPTRGSLYVQCLAHQPSPGAEIVCPSVPEAHKILKGILPVAVGRGSLENSFSIPPRRTMLASKTT